jgi:hypothetical protein
MHAPWYEITNYERNAVFDTKLNGIADGAQGAWPRTRTYLSMCKRYAEEDLAPDAHTFFSCRGTNGPQLPNLPCHTQPSVF